MKKKSAGSKVTAQLQSGIDSARKQIQAAVGESGKKLGELRHKAADAALQWVLGHDDRVSAFRRSVKGSPIEKAFDALLKLLRAEARPAHKPAKRRAAPRKRKAAKPAA
jgi:hypothetical protein